MLCNQYMYCDWLGLGLELGLEFRIRFIILNSKNKKFCITMVEIAKYHGRNSSSPLFIYIGQICINTQGFYFAKRQKEEYLVY